MPLKRLSLALALALALVPGPQAAMAQGDQVALHTDARGARDLARRALETRQPGLAADIARQILAQRPEDLEAQLILTAALTRAGQPADAARVGRQGFKAAPRGEARFEAAYLTAEAHAAAGHPLRSRYWLRRADDHAPSPAHRALIGAAWNQVGQTTPLSFHVAVQAGPSENVNGGSLHEYFYAWDVIPIAIDQALPGFVTGLAGQVSYRLGAASSLQASLVHREVTLSDRAKAIDPDARGSDYRQTELGLGYVRQVDLGPDLGLAARGAIGQRWRGGEVASRAARVDLALVRRQGERLRLGMKLGFGLEQVPERRLADNQTTRLGLLASRLDPRLGALTAELGVTQVASDAAGVAWRGPSLSLGWRPDLGTDRLGLDLDLSLESRDYWKTVGFDPDLRMGVSVTAEMKQLRTMGFNPTLTLSASRTRSDLVVRDSRDLGVSFGLASSF